MQPIREASVSSSKRNRNEIDGDLSRRCQRSRIEEKKSVSTPPGGGRTRKREKSSRDSPTSSAAKWESGTLFNWLRISNIIWLEIANLDSYISNESNKGIAETRDMASSPISWKDILLGQLCRQNKGKNEERVACGP
ncbi:hypothetical protein SASPL_152175 [Salvia splendens]|uniref:Uncharacterized protein n=1 Tax=Salvia splendens TaxID=180675 RepID=A0A8X8W2S8_SALSN|nr:hypothetical protein SASPL_152175 [Salvia splendens]